MVGHRSSEGKAWLDDVETVGGVTRFSRASTRGKSSGVVNVAFV